MLGFVIKQMEVVMKKEGKDDREVAITALNKIGHSYALEVMKGLGLPLSEENVRAGLKKEMGC